MGYRRAETVLPQELIQLIQQYVDGESIYIPRKEGCRAQWGKHTAIRQELEERNAAIAADYESGMETKRLAEKYFLSEKSIQRIIREHIIQKRMG